MSPQLQWTAHLAVGCVTPPHGLLQLQQAWGGGSCVRSIAKKECLHAWCVSVCADLALLLPVFIVESCCFLGPCGSNFTNDLGYTERLLSHKTLWLTQPQRPNLGRRVRDGLEVQKFEPHLLASLNVEPCTLTSTPGAAGEHDLDTQCALQLSTKASRTTSRKDVLHMLLAAINHLAGRADLQIPFGSSWT